MAPRDANVPSGGSSGKSKPARAGWRSNSARTPAPVRHGVSRSWWNVRRTEPTHDANFRAKLAVSIVLLATLVAAFVIFLREKPTKVPMVALAATYRGSHLLPPNSWTIEDFERFEGQLANRGPGGFLSADAGLGEVDVRVFRDDWIGGPRQGENALVQLRDLLKPVVPGGPKSNVVLIYISAHGVVNKDGDPCLLLEDSAPLDATTWLPVRSLCEQICEVKPSERIVLILDCNRIEVSGQCGLLYNSFAERLRQLVEDKLDKKLCRNLVVLNSTDPGEVAWAAPELGGSAFGYFFCQALSGAADRDDDGELSLYELNAYLRRRVDRWVVDHRSGSQRPMEPLFVEDKQDFPLAYCGASQATPALAEAETRRLEEAYGRWHREQDWDAVANLWILHDKLRDEKLYHVDPLAWAAFERGLLRLEQLLLAGKAYERECRELPERLRQAIDAAAQKRKQDVALYNLPLVGQFTTVLPKADAKPESIPVEPDPAEAALSPHDRYYRQANRAWTGLLKKNPITLQDSSAALGMIKEPLGKDGADLVEVHFLRVLGRYLDKPVSAANDLVERAIRSRQQAERAAAPADERVQYWVSRHLDKGDSARRDAEDLLFVGAPAADDKNAARADFDQHEKRAWQSAEDDYLTAQSVAEETGKAFDLRDRGWARAPYLALWQWGERIRPQQDAALRTGESQRPEQQRPEQWDRLMSVVRQLHILSRELDESLATADQRPTADATPASGGIWKRPNTEKLNEDLRLLEAAFEAISIRLDDEGKQQENLVKIERHLALPLVSASHRNSLRERFLSLLQDKYEANKRSPGDPQSGLSSQGVDQKNAPFSHPDLLGGFPNHPYVALLTIDTEPVAEKPPAAGAAKPTWADQLGQLAVQGDKVRTALGSLTASVTRSLDESRKQLAQVHDRLSENPEKSDKSLDLKKIADVRRGRSDADRLVRAAAALCDYENVSDPTPELRKFDLHQLMLRQCQRTLDDFWGPAGPSGKPYFELVAQDYLRAAEGLCREPDAVALRAQCAGLLARRSKAAQTLLTAASTEDLSIRNQEQELVQLPLAVRRRSDDLPRGVAAAFVRHTDGQGGELVPLTKRRPGSAAGGDGAGSWIRRIGVPTEGAPAAALGIVEQPADGMGVDYWFKPESNRTALEAVICYRGHELPSGIEIAPPGVRIVYEPKRPPAPSVRVRGDEKVPTSVMFIFDCSASMHERDFPRGDGTAVRRLDGARDTLISILKQPSLRQFRGVGLRIYGHRFGQNKKSEVQLSKFANAQRQRALAAGTPFAQRHPGADVELAFPSEFLDQQRRDEMISTLGSLESWGFTPLYLAISDAVNDPRPKDERRRIIAITDGFNEQGGVGIESQVTARALEDLLIAHPKVTLDIIGFGNEFSRDARAKAQDLADMKRIAARQGGGFYQAATAGDLLKRILKSLSLGKFEVVPAGSPPTETEKFELENETWHGEEPPRSAAGLQRRHKKYDVRVVEIDSPVRPSMPIELEGGEALELYLERAGNTPQLAYRYYDPDRKLDLRSRDAAAVDERLNLLGRILPPAGAGIRDRGKYWLASLTPAWQSQERLAKFFISIQNYTLTKFSPRPAEAWIEITPINEDGEVGGAVYRFCDLDFASGRPVPVLECEARRFPHDTCKKARTQVWFSMEPTRGDAVVTATVADLKKRGETVDGVRISADVIKESDASVAVRIREQRMENETGKFRPGRVKIQMSPLPLRVEHDYDARRHTFYFEQDAEVDDFIVRLTSVEKFKKEAISGTLPETEVGR